jgi:diguanylate cyclase (GGDEF)-like protein
VLIVSAKEADTVLVIDDEEINRMALTQILSQEFAVVTATDGRDGIEKALALRPTLILLDIMMPGMGGFDVLRELKHSKETANIPVIIITGLDKEEDEEAGFFFGAVDYITKPFKRNLVRARVRNQMQIVHHIRTAETLGYLDELTRLPNRRQFNERIEQEWNRCMREQTPLSFLMMDIDHFKEYNDTYGHPQGDVLLRTIANIFREQVQRASDMVARLGGEEFGVLLPATDSAQARAIAEKIRSAVESAVIQDFDGKRTQITLSVGLATIVPTKDQLPKDLVSAADAKLYNAKGAGRNQVC